MRCRRTSPKANKAIPTLVLCATQNALNAYMHQGEHPQYRYAVQHKASSTAPLKCHKVSQNQAAHMQTKHSNDFLLKK